MRNPTRTIPDDVAEVLRAARCEGNNLYLVGTLDRKLYARTNDVLVSLGGVWKSGKVKAHVFPGNAAEALAAALDTGSYTTEKDLAFFATPPELVQRMIRLAGVKFGDKVLEPSAGGGNIARALRDVIRGGIFCVEFDEKRACALRDDGFETMQLDFLSITPGTIGPFDAVVMNPPFALVGQTRADIDHVEHAIKFLKPGGRLAAIMAAGVTFRDDNRSKAFRALIGGRGSIEELPVGTFKAAGTGVQTVLVTYTAG